jgi:hypothetical protein
MHEKPPSKISASEVNRIWPGRLRVIRGCQNSATSYSERHIGAEKFSDLLEEPIVSRNSGRKADACGTRGRRGSTARSCLAAQGALWTNYRARQEMRPCLEAKRLTKADPQRLYSTVSILT